LCVLAVQVFVDYLLY